MQMNGDYEYSWAITADISTESYVITADETACWSSTSPGRCFTFRFSPANTNSNLQSAQLWVYWNGPVFSESPSSKVNLSVEGKPTPSNTGFTPISTDDLNDVTHPGCVTFELTHVVRRWHRHNREDHSILVTCEECAWFEHQVTSPVHVVGIGIGPTHCHKHSTK